MNRAHKILDIAEEMLKRQLQNEKLRSDMLAGKVPIPDQPKPGYPVPPTAEQIAAEKAATLKANELPLIFFDEARNAPVQRYHIKGFLAEGATSSVFAPPKTMKSTIVTDAGVHLAAGKPDWRGHRIREAKAVVYFAFERHIQVRQALAAYAIRDELENLPFAVVPRLVNMLDHDCVELIMNAIDRVQQRHGIEAALAVFDTWNKGIAAGGGNEDKAEHQNAAAANLRRLIEQIPQLHCLTIGHTGKEVSKGERGSNATSGDRDLGCGIKGENGKFALEIEYANSLPPGEIITTFEGEQIEIGKDDDGEPVNSFIVSRSHVAAPMAKSSTKLTTKEQLALEALREVLKTAGKSGHEIGGRSVTRHEWLDECLRRGAIGGDNPWRDLQRRQEGLLAAGRIIVLDDRVRLQRDGGSGEPKAPVTMPTLPSSNGIPLPPGYRRD
ncbi:MAG: AAA family ATPase [Bradyrhizobium sp.]